MYNSQDTRHRLGVIDSGGLLWIIALAVLSILFGLLAYNSSSQAELIIEGDSQHPQFTPSTALRPTRARINEVKAEIAALEERIAIQEAYTRRLDYELSGMNAYWTRNPTGQGWLFGGDEQQGGWRITQQTIAQRAARLQAWSQAHGRAETQRFDRLEDITRQFQDQQQQVLVQSADRQARFDQEREALVQQGNRLTDERQEAEARHRMEKSEAETSRLRLDQEIRELLDLRLEWLGALEPDATILRVDLDRRFVILNRGRADGILPGLRFEVFTYDRGTYTVKGLVEVVDLGAHIATCRILEEVDPRHLPLHPGDMVGNPVFNAQQPQVFVLAGEFSKFNRSDLEEFIRQAGGQVRSELMPGVNYLVAGERSDWIQDRAREYQVIAMYEESLVRFLNTTFRP